MHSNTHTNNLRICNTRASTCTSTYTYILVYCTGNHFAPTYLSIHNSMTGPCLVFILPPYLPDPTSMHALGLRSRSSGPHRAFLEAGGIRRMAAYPSTGRRAQQLTRAGAIQFKAEYTGTLSLLREDKQGLKDLQSRLPTTKLKFLAADEKVKTGGFVRASSRGQKLFEVGARSPKPQNDLFPGKPSEPSLRRK